MPRIRLVLKILPSSLQPRLPTSTRRRRRAGTASKDPGQGHQHKLGVDSESHHFALGMVSAMI